MNMAIRRLGRGGLDASPLGLGCMGMSGMYGAADRNESIQTIVAAIEANVTLIDTGDFYGMGHNETLIAEALHGIARHRYQLSLKFGALRDPANGWVGTDCRPKSIRNFLAYSLQRLGTDYIDIYRPARLDPDVPIEDTMGEIARCIDAGWVRHVGLSEVGPKTLRRAAAVHPISDLQIEYSLLARSIESDILPTCRDLGIGITAYGVLSRGLISGKWKAGDAGPKDFRHRSPRFVEGNVAANLSLVNNLRPLAASKDVTVAQLVIAWVLAQSDDVVPVVGARKRSQLREALAAVEVSLTAADLDAIEAAMPRGAAKGGRYPAAVLAALDSECPK